MIFSNTNYIDLAETLLFSGYDVGNTKELTNIKFTINASNPIPYHREPSAIYLLAELVWYFSHENSTKFIGYFADLWNHISDDGKIANSAYGYIIHEKYGFDQIEKMIALLKKDPLSRRAVININAPNENVINTKDEICTIALQLLIRDGKLNMTGIMRSNDIWYGTPYDVVYFTAIQQYIAFMLDIKAGTYTHFVTSLHVYNKDIPKLNQVLDNYYKNPTYGVNKEYDIDYLWLIKKANKLHDRILDEIITPKARKSLILDIMREEGII